MRPLHSIFVKKITTQEQTLFSAKSTLIDRMVPNTEKIILPPTFKPEGCIKLELPSDQTQQKNVNISNKRKLLNLFRKQVPLAIPNSYIIDFRVHAPQNWSHILNLHIPYALKLQAELQTVKEGKALTFLLPKNAPEYIRKVLTIFQINAVFTDAATFGEHLVIDSEDWRHVQTARHLWVKEHFLQLECSDMLFEQSAHIPKNVFLSRKNTRNLINEAEVNEVLSQYDFELIYPEDLSVLDQIKLFVQADNIVAIHGAGLAPLLYSQHKVLNIVEIFSPAHMSEHFRAMANILGHNWVGLRGKLEKKHIKHAYIPTPYTEHSLDAFELELTSLKRALEHLFAIGKDAQQNSK